MKPKLFKSLAVLTMLVLPMMLIPYVNTYAATTLWSVPKTGRYIKPDSSSLGDNQWLDSKDFDTVAHESHYGNDGSSRYQKTEQITLASNLDLTSADAITLNFAISTNDSNWNAADAKVYLYDKNGDTIKSLSLKSVSPDPVKADYDKSVDITVGADNKYSKCKLVLDWTMKYWTGPGGPGWYYKGSIVVKAAHSHDYDQEVATSTYKKSDATCTKKAVYYKSCKCGAKGTATFESGNALGHDWKDATKSNNNGVKTAPTCTADGVYYKYCSRCDAKDTSKYNTVSGTATGHDFTSASSKWTAYNAPVINWSGYTATYTQTGTKKCSRCDETKSNQTAVTATACTVTNAITVWPSYTAKGTRTYTASTGTVNGKSAAATKTQDLAKLTAPTTLTALNAAYGKSPIPTTSYTITPVTGSVTQAPAYKWQVSSDGTNWSDLTNTNGWSGVTTATVGFNPAEYNADLKYIHCVVTTKLTDPNHTNVTSSASVTSPQANVWSSGALASFAPTITTDLTAVICDSSLQTLSHCNSYPHQSKSLSDIQFSMCDLY